MEEVDKNIVDELKMKVRRLIEFYEASQAKNSQLLQENENLKKELKQKESEVVSFQERFSNMKLAEGIASVESNHDAKIKINKIVREIDRCIALLNK